MSTLAASDHSSSSSNRSAYCSRRMQTCRESDARRSVQLSLGCTSPASTHLLLKGSDPVLHLGQTHSHDIFPRIAVADGLEVGDVL